jgi:hypothetical protein
MHNKFTSEAEIERVGRGVEDRTLPKPEWTHAAHFAAALWVLRRGEHGRMPGLIRAYNEATGVANTETDGYHETITLASLRAANAVLMRWPKETPLHIVHTDLMAGVLGRSDWPLAYWSAPLLFSTAARLSWIDPDLAPLPFERLAP